MLRRNVLLGVTALVALATPIVVGLIRVPQMLAGPSQISGASIFAVASVQPSPSANEGTTIRFAPGRLTLANWTAKSLIAYAYNTPNILGGPLWIDSERYVIDVNVDDSQAYESGKLIEFNSAGRFPPGLRQEQLMLTLQLMLADRLKLKLNHETKELPAYSLVVADGLKLHEARPGNDYANGIIGFEGSPVGPHTSTGQNGHLIAQALPMSTVAEILSQQLGRTVVDRTGLTGDYDFTLEWTPDGNQAATSGNQAVDNSSSQESAARSIFTAIEQQLGLKLEPEEIPADFLVIGQTEKP